MNNKLIGVVAFTVGALSGFAVATKFMKDKYERIAQEEINSMKAYYKGKYGIAPIPQQDISAIESKPVFTGAVSDAVLEVEENKKETVAASNGTWARVDEKIYMITPDELGEFDDYDVVGLSYYEDDHVLCDNDDNRVDFDVIGGKDMLENFGEYEEDVLQVRNETHRTDYEVYLIHNSYIDEKALD